jgi:uncharacterized membrane protein
MNKMLIGVFDSERQAYDGTRALKDLHAEGTITLYGHSVLVKDASGNVSVKESSGGPLGTAVGVLTGALVGLIGGPVGVAIGTTAGVLVGVPFDMANVGIDAGFLQRAAERLEPGKAAVLAEVEEEWILPVDTRLEAAGGTVFRRGRADVAADLIQEDVDVMEAVLADLRAEYDQASGEARARLQARIESSEAELRQARDRARVQAEATEREAEAKVTSLKEQAAASRADVKQKLDKRASDVEAAYKARIAKLGRAKELRKEASQLTREALTP